MATYSSILAWRIPWTEKPARLQYAGLKELDTTEQQTLSLSQTQYFRTQLAWHWVQYYWCLGCDVQKGRSKKRDIKKPTNNKRWRGCREKEILLHCWQECKLVNSYYIEQYGSSLKTKTELPYDPVIPLLGQIFRRDRHTNLKSYMHCNVRSSTTISKTWKQSKYLTNKWIKKTWYIYTMEYYSVTKSSDTMPYSLSY